MSSEQDVSGLNNPLGIDGIEFIEYATAQPVALGALLEQLGCVASARHRSREVTLYRQGAMHVIVNGARDLAQAGADSPSTVVSAIALRVRDAAAARAHAVAQGAWAIPTRAGAMELNIPGVHGVGDSILYFVERLGESSIYDVASGAPDVPLATRVLQERGIVFGTHPPTQPGAAGALTQMYQGGVSFELVASQPPQEHP